MVIWPELPFVYAQVWFYGTGDAFGALWRWMPFLLTSGFLVQRPVISMLAMAIGTVAGGSAWDWGRSLLLKPLRSVCLVCHAALPQFALVGAAFHCAAGAAVSRVKRSLVSTVPCSGLDEGCLWPQPADHGQYLRGGARGSAICAHSASGRRPRASPSPAVRSCGRSFMPQCYKRMLPPWMNWYAILTMATPLCSLLGIEETHHAESRQAMEAEDNHPELLVPFFGLALLLFFIYCYPIARWTIHLERKFAVKL